MGASLKRVGVPGIPFLLSVGLSLSTVGTAPYWQDSGLFLTAVKEMTVLYPPGFVVYLFLCKAWTVLFFFLDFTLAVHLFSSACAAAAAGVLALAVRDLLRGTAPLVRVGTEDDAPNIDVASISAGCLAASGFTFWFAGIYAKVYAFYFLVLAILIWRMIRAAETGKPRDFTIVAVFIGLAWQAHPSASLAGIALVAYVLYHRRQIGLKGIAWRAGVSAAVALGPLLALPLLAANESLAGYGHPVTAGGLFDYVIGARYIGRPGGFGWEASRAAGLCTYFFEEMLLIGLIVLGTGLVHLVRKNRMLFLGLGLWTLPFLSVTLLFRMEGQHDLWGVAAWLPLYLALGAGFLMAARALGRPVVAGTAAVAVLWAAVVNFPDLEQRKYDLAETFGESLLKNVDPGSIVLPATDNVIALSLYMRFVRKERPDAYLINSAHLGLDWFDRRVEREFGFGPPDYLALRSAMPGATYNTFWITAFVNQHVRPGRPAFSFHRPDSRYLDSRLQVIPAGLYWKTAVASEATLDLKYWEGLPRSQDLVSLRRRPRAQVTRLTADGLGFTVEPYRNEDKFLDALVSAELRLAELVVKSDPGKALALMDSAGTARPKAVAHPAQMFHRAVALMLLRRFEEAAKVFIVVAQPAVGADPRLQALSHYYLGEIFTEQGHKNEARSAFRNALRFEVLDAGARRRIEEFLKGP